MYKQIARMSKLVVVGDSAVGKTNLLLRYLDDTYTETFLSTIGVDFKFKTFEKDGITMKLQIWDTAGQERFRTLTTSYYKGAQGIYLVYAVDSIESFRSIEGWIAQVRANAKQNVKIVLIGNKCDVSADKRQVSFDEGQRLAQEHNIMFIETSAKNNTNVTKAFESLPIMILESEDADTQDRGSIESPTQYKQSLKPREKKAQGCCGDKDQPCYRKE